MSICPTCGSDTRNPRFCSRTCSAIYNNRAAPKRKRKTFICKICGAETAYRRQFCDRHQPRAPLDRLTTIGSVRRRAKYQANARIRQIARRAYKAFGRPLQCEVCGYSTHVEVCHKHSISEFSDDTLITEVNSRDNLVCLCPNHHWEFDHGLLSL